MKKIIVLFTSIAALAVVSVSCNPDANKQESNKEVIVVPSKTVIIEKEPEKKSTTITLDKKGVKVEAKKIDVTIKNQ